MNRSPLPRSSREVKTSDFDAILVSVIVDERTMMRRSNVEAGDSAGSSLVVELPPVQDRVRKTVPIHATTS